MSSPLTTSEFQTLRESAESSYLKDKPYRDNVRGFVRAAAGSFYGAGDPGGNLNEVGAVVDTPLNLEALFVRAAMAELSARSVRAMVQTDVEDWASWAETYELALNRHSRRMKLGEQIDRCTMGGLFGLGILKIGQNFTIERLSDGQEYLKPEVFASAIDFGRFIRDGRARNLAEADYLGHDEDMPLGMARRNPLFDEEARLRLTADMATPQTEDQAGIRLESSSDLSTAFRKSVTIREVWVRPLNRIVAWAIGKPELKLMDVPWEGEPNGPFVFCGFEWLLNHALPISPFAHLHMIHQAGNAFLAKAIEQQQKQKNLLGYDGAAEEEVKRIVESVENQTYLKTTGLVQPTSLMGAAQSTVGMFQLMRELFSYAAGNLDQRSGLATQSPTLGQEQLLSAAADKLTESMKLRVIDVTREIFEKIGWYMLRDDWSEDVLRKPIGRTGATIPAAWTPDIRRELRDVQWEFRIDPYTLGDMAPQTRLSRYLGGLDYIQGRFRQDMAQQGVGFDVEAVIRNVRKLTGEPMFDETFIFNQDADKMMAAMGPPDASRDSGMPKRYTRESVSSGDQKQDTIMRMFSGQGQQPEAL